MSTTMPNNPLARLIFLALTIVPGTGCTDDPATQDQIPEVLATTADPGSAVPDGVDELTPEIAEEREVLTAPFDARLDPPRRVGAARWSSRLTNVGQREDSYVLTVDGPPSSTTTVRPGTLDLAPGESAEISLELGDPATVADLVVVSEGRDDEVARLPIQSE